jgi:hypothetical protein
MIVQFPLILSFLSKIHRYRNSIEIPWKKLISMEIYIEMSKSKSVKVVDVIPDVEEAPQEEVKEEIPQEEVKEIKEEINNNINNNNVDNVVNTKVDEKKKPQEMVTCTICNKEMTAKTLKYSHKKLCGVTPPPPPPPPPPPVEVVKPKSKPRPKKTTVVEEFDKPVVETKQEFKGVVDFNHKIPTQEDIHNQLRQQRVVQKQTRIKSLISQAL